MVRTAGLSAIAVMAVAFLASLWNFALTQSVDGQITPPAKRSRTSPPAAATSPADEVLPEFKQAGVCARCHVVSVLEWGLSGHVEAETNCQECHGTSLKHIADERNEVKPDHLPRGAVPVTRLCSQCHETGCPESLEVQNCQKCHHVHALINPAKPPATKNERLEKLLARWERCGKQMANGDQHVTQQDWKAAQTAYSAALELIPGNHRAVVRLQMCNRRLNPHLPGFKADGDTFDPETGLPHKVQIAGLEIPMLLVPTGEFDIGSDKLADSRPVHTVTVDAFYLGQYEVTQAEWKAIMNANPSAHQKADFPNAQRMPVERVSWNDCQDFLHRLNARVEGGGFRLPSEAEWEYACRCGPLESGLTSRNRHAGEELSDRAWYRANSLRQPTPSGTFLQIDAYAPRSVGTRDPNAWGFCDMQGNVSEWCSSLYRPYLFHPSDGRESLTETGMRVVRGGGFANSAAALDPALRHAERPHRRLRWNGLRLARSVPSPEKKAPASNRL
jgi:formylglycine-generating enzyme required for sulfatase activity